MKTINNNDQALMELSHEDLTNISGGEVTAEDVGKVVGYAAGFLVGGVMVLGIMVFKSNLS